MIRRLGVLALCALVLPASAQAWTWPVDGPVLRPFSFDRAHPYAGGQHRGVDLGAPAGTNVRAPAQGVVTFTGTVPTGGKTVSIETPFGYTATLVHLGSIAVTRGATVTEGAVVGTVGPSGVPDHAEPYVYFGLRMTGQEQGYVDPLSFLPPPLRPAAQAPTPSREPETSPVPVAAAAASSAPTDAAEPATAAPAETAAGTASGALVVAPAAADAVAGKHERSTSEPVRERHVSRAATERRGAAAREQLRPQVEVQRPHAPRHHHRLPEAQAPGAVHSAPAQAARPATRHARSTGPRAWWILGLVIALLSGCVCLWRIAKRLDA